MATVDFDALFHSHLAAIRASVRAGFRFRHLPTGQEDEFVLQGFRVENGVMDTYLTYAADDAVAARYRVSDLELPDPPALWRRDGPVDEVVLALLALPAHGARGSPMAAGFPVHFGIPPHAHRARRHPESEPDPPPEAAEPSASSHDSAPPDVLSRIPRPRAGGCVPNSPTPRGSRFPGGAR
ncbi:hypothetical protein GCM10027271_16020 [Saccharopolyspora gloriosae]|uniref:Uncharacterized protein n=1 Tax=Saccharopolyspora gloriosae TaxID=455344 RepID=A0A840ND53_9PSEU|nr:hypothetical protein [Saccharopolyspora gloriosae]MBB5067152.1 hypothetical protein [Saccharopolyspora gloriosae]